MKTVIVGYWAKPSDEMFLSYIREQYDGDLGDEDYYDMTLYPEKGDVIDAIEKGLRPDLVICLHLFGTGANLTAMSDGGFFYTKRNHQLWHVCGSRGIRLAVCGESEYGPQRWRFVEPFVSVTK